MGDPPPSYFLEGLGPSERKEVLDASSPRHYVTHSVVTDQGAPANHLFLITTGRARHFFVAPDGRKVLLFGLPPGDIFGSTAILRQHVQYIVSTETVKDSDVLVWDRDTLRALAHKHPALLENVLHLAKEYLAWYATTHLALTCQDARGRLACVLYNLSWVAGHRDITKDRALDVTDEELATAANLSQATVSRVLSEWQDQGLLVKTRGHLLISAYPTLFQYAASKGEPPFELKS